MIAVPVRTPSRRRPPGAAWLLSPLLVALTTWALFEVQRLVGRVSGQDVRPYGIGYLLPIAVLTALGGARVGGLTLALSLLSAMFVLMEPRFSLRVADPRDLAEMAFIASLGVLTLYAVDAWQRSDQLLAVAQDAQRDAERALHDLRVSEQRLRTVVANVPVILFALDKDGVFTFTDGKGLAALNRAPGEAVGRSIFDLYANAPALLDHVREALAGRASHWHAQINGLTYDTFCTPLSDKRGASDGIIGVAFDVSHRLRAEEALRESQERYRLLTEAVPALAWSNRPDGSAAFFNRRWNDYAGPTQESDRWAGTPTWIQVVHPDDRARLIQTRTHAAETGTPYESEVRLRRRDGVYRWHLSRVVPLTDNTGAISAWFGAALDITERREAEEEIRRLNENLERRVAERTAQLEIANAELEAFSYSVSHDLRAPLRAMQGFAQALEEDYGHTLDAVAHDYTRRISAAADRMDQLIHDLLDYSRLGRADLNLRPVPLAAALEDARSQITADLRERQAELDVAPGLPAVCAHRTILVQVLANLLSNAVKFVAPGTTPRVRIWAEKRDNDTGVRLWVEDNGLGIAPEHQGRIFRVFERLHGVETYPGTGIGLAIVRKGIERMDGEAGVVSAPGSGSRFWIELPAAEEAHHE